MRRTREALLFASAAGAYFVARYVVEGSQPRAIANAEHVLDVERALSLDIERGFQKLAFDVPGAIEFFNRCYVWLHWPFIIAGFAFLVAKAPERAAMLRWSMIASGIVGLVIFALFPVAPPRFIEGFVGTVSQAERQHFLRFPSSWQNRFAALPSYHVGWTLLTSLALIPCFRHRGAQITVIAPAPLVAIAVIVTGNHYVIDAIVGVGISLAAWAIVGRLSAGRSRGRDVFSRIPAITTGGTRSAGPGPSNSS